MKSRQDRIAQQKDLANATTVHLDATMRPVSTEYGSAGTGHPAAPKSNTETEPGAPADKQVIVRVTEEMREYWKAAAEATGISLSEMIRDIVQTHAVDILECPHPPEQQKVYPWSRVCLKCGIRLEG